MLSEILSLEVSLWAISPIPSYIIQIIKNTYIQKHVHKYAQKHQESTQAKGPQNWPKGKSRAVWLDDGNNSIGHPKPHYITLIYGLFWGKGPWKPIDIRKYLQFPVSLLQRNLHLLCKGCLSDARRKEMFWFGARTWRILCKQALLA